PDTAAPGCPRLGCGGAQAAGGDSASQCALRAAHRHAATGMLGLPDSLLCTPYGARPHAVGTPLQRRSPAYGLGAGYSPAACGAAGAPAGAAASMAGTWPGGGASDPWRPAS